MNLYEIQLINVYLFCVCSAENSINKCVSVVYNNGMQCNKCLSFMCNNSV